MRVQGNIPPVGEKRTFRLIMPFWLAWFSSLFPLWYSVRVSVVYCRYKNRSPPANTIAFVHYFLKGLSIINPSLCIDVANSLSMSWHTWDLFIFNQIFSWQMRKKALWWKLIWNWVWSVFISERMVVFKNDFAGSFKFVILLMLQ